MKAAVIGIGHLGKFHAQKYAQLGILTAIADIDLSTGRKQAEQLDCAYYENYRELLDKVDLVSIATPTVLHHPISCDFLRAGVHSLVEKPIALNCEEASEMIRLAKAKSLVLQIGHIERFNPIFKLLQEHCHKPKYINVERLAPFRNRSTDINVVLDLMVHDLDLIFDLMQSPVKDLRGLGIRVISNYTDAANVHLLFANGAMANISASRISRSPLRMIRIFQNDLYASANMEKQQLTITTMDANQELQEKEYSLENNDANDALLSEIKAFVFAVENNAPPLVSGEDGMRTLAIALRLNELLKEDQE